MKRAATGDDGNGSFIVWQRCPLDRPVALLNLFVFVRASMRVNFRAQVSSAILLFLIIAVLIVDLDYPLLGMV